jgi:hypothetical protein
VKPEIRAAVVGTAVSVASFAALIAVLQVFGREVWAGLCVGLVLGFAFAAWALRNG